MPAEFQMTDDTSHHLQSVMAHLAKSLKLLDKAQAPGDIGAYVDLALQRVRQTLGLPEVAVEIDRTAQSSGDQALGAHISALPSAALACAFHDCGH